MTKKITSILFLFFLSFYGLKAQHDLTFAYEGFDYLNTVNIPMNAGSTFVNGSGIKYWNNANGWAGDWVVYNNNAGIPSNDYSISVSNLPTDYTAGSAGNPIKSIVSSGHYAQGGSPLSGPAGIYAGRKLQTSTAGPFSNNVDFGIKGTHFDGLINKDHKGNVSLGGKIGRDTTTLFVGLLIQKYYNDGDSTFVTLHSNAFPYQAYGGNTISVGYFGAKSDNAGNKVWTVRVNDQVYFPTVISPSNIIDTTKPALITLSIDFDKINGNRVSFWVNPSDVGADNSPVPIPIADKVVVTPKSDFSLTSIAYFGGNKLGASIIDEIRFAGSYKYATQASEVVSIVSGLCPGNLGDNVYPKGTFGKPGDFNFGAAPGAFDGDDLANVACTNGSALWCSPTNVYFRKQIPPWSNFPPASTYIYRPDAGFGGGNQLNDGEYTIVSELRNRGNATTNNCGGFDVPQWITKLAPSGMPNDYLMMINSDFHPYVFYEQTVDKLCSGVRYEFSLDIINIVDYERVSFSNPASYPVPLGCVTTFDPRCDPIAEPGCQQYSQPLANINNGSVTDGCTIGVGNCSYYTISPDIEFLINDVVVYTLPSPIPNDATWHKVGFTFTTKDLSKSKYGNGILKLTLRNKAPGGDGNDLAVDNIRFLPCGPTIGVSGSANGCDVKVTASVDPAFDKIFWQFTDDTTNFSWKNIKFSTGQNPFTFTISPVLNDTMIGRVPPGYFVRAIAGGGNFDINNPKCRVASNGKLVNCIIPLPITLLNFLAEKVLDGVSLKWQTTYEKNNLKFIVERAGDDQNFVDIGSVDGRGNSTNLNTYYFKDYQPLIGNNYYKLRQVDFDGKETDSKIISINITGLISVFPNPADRNLIIQFGENSKSDRKVNLKFVSALGKIISEQNPIINKNENQVIIENLPASNGVYYLEIIHQGTKTVKKIVVAH